MDKEMKALIDAPLADPLKMHLPKGRKVLRRGPRHKHVDNIGAEKPTSDEVAERRSEDYHSKIAQLLDYYSTTQVPVERVAEHVGLDVDRTAAALKRRGREI